MARESKFSVSPDVLRERIHQIINGNESFSPPLRCIRIPHSLMPIALRLSLLLRIRIGGCIALLRVARCIALRLLRWVIGLLRLLLRIIRIGLLSLRLLLLLLLRLGWLAL